MFTKRISMIATILTLTIIPAIVLAEELSFEPPNHKLALSAAAIKSKELNSNEQVDARKPLTFKDMGLYGWWQPYFWEGPFDFVIVQTFVHPHESLMRVQNFSTYPELWNENLMKARAAGKRVIVLMTPAQGKTFTEEDYHAMVNFLDKVHRNELYAVTLAEENIFWGGQHEQLVSFYHRLKEKFPDVPIYQFYSNTGRGTARPGFTWPWLPADGWGMDEYWAMPDDLEELLVRYRILGLPLVNIMWASPYRPIDYPFHTNTFHGQLRIAKKYNLPCAFFCADDLTTDKRTFGWHAKARDNSKAVFNLVLAELKKVKAIPEEELYQWDDAGEFKATILVKNDKGKFSYRESFDLRMKPAGETLPEHDFMTRSLIKGLPHMQLKPNPSRILVRSTDRKKDVDTSMTIQWRTPDGESCQFIVSAKIMVEPKTSVNVIFEVSTNGYDWIARTTEIKDGLLQINVPEANNELYTRLRISGKAKEAREVLAKVDWIEVQGSVVK